MTADVEHPGAIDRSRTATAGAKQSSRLATLFGLKLGCI